MQTTVFRNGRITKISVQVNDGAFIEGNRIPEVKTIPITNSFDCISSTGPIDVDFVASEANSIEILADGNLIDLIDISYFGNSLEISVKEEVNFRTQSPLRVKVSYPNLQSVELVSSGNINIFNLEENEFEALLTGSGNINLAGTVENVTLVLSGSGKIDSGNLKASNLVAKLNGSGDINAVAILSAATRLAGSGNINIYGNPASKQTKCTGSGRINFR